MDVWMGGEIAARMLLGPMLPVSSSCIEKCWISLEPWSFSPLAEDGDVGPSMSTLKARSSHTPTLVWSAHFRSSTLSPTGKSHRGPPSGRLASLPACHGPGCGAPAVGEAGP